jgi:hypothetical protein
MTTLVNLCAHRREVIAPMWLGVLLLVSSALDGRGVARAGAAVVEARWK